MHFRHADDIWAEHPTLVAGVARAGGITPDGDVDAALGPLHAVARARLAGAAESDLPEIQAWRRTFTRLGLKPTRYRCAAESLLRRFRREGTLPRIHPLIDLGNALSLAYAIPVAVFDLDRVAGFLEVRHADGGERYLTFGGEVEHPRPGEVIFADAEGRAHARRWTNRQSGHSAVRDGTREVLVVAEALHGSAARDVPALLTALVEGLQRAWPGAVRTAVLSAGAPRFPPD
ncbi:B3/B4 domain-containing protein [Prauserella muralis]|uniref:Uncharacterized protein n=1 Tax=Prauserella muralis TaxID=588067 RepID=A0A2V4BFG9_9PSEU|nr:phenylalanine--tRNA ligase beta subunit-related protein [Prauserella muralis]PXY32799.1 hypothetical protein BAY60_07485 [Prauserella muralis]TWE24219.1 phosphoenolpyruvate synthase [Prauserella muralis]